MVAKAFTAWYGRLFNAGNLRRLQNPKPGWFADTHLSISFRGIKTGKQYTLPINYRETAQGTIIIGTESRWWRNLEHGAQVDLVIRGQSKSGYATLISVDDERRETFGRMLAGVSWRWFSKSLHIFEITDIR